MTLSSLILSSFKNLKRNLKKSILTMIGVIIGITSIITILALGEAYRNKTIQNFTGKNKGSIVLNVTFDPNNNLKNLKQSYFTEHDKRLLKDKYYIESLELLYDNQTFGGLVNFNFRGKQIRGTLGNFEKTNNKNIIGRNLNKLDNDRLNKVAIINENMLPKEYNIEKYLGDIITLDNIAYEIIGIITLKEAEKNSIFTIEPSVKIPKKTYEKYSRINNITYGIKIIIKNNVDVKKSIDDIEMTLNENGTNKDRGKYEVFDNTGIINILGTVLNTITIFIALIAGISLFIAGIGVMNMIYTSVSERTLEIGIKRALGAKKKDIEREFLIEGIIITLSGGIIGYILGILITFIISYFLKFTLKLSLTTIIIALTISIIIGIVSSILPAKKAANRNTIDILK